MAIPPNPLRGLQKRMWVGLTRIQERPKLGVKAPKPSTDIRPLSGHLD
jgi:hypothetical protein